MIPLRLNITGFLSYRDSVELDFSSFDLACISGSNGAGKSSLLDALTWSLFGESRTREKEALIHLAEKSAQVIFTFSYEANEYQTQRSITRGKSTLLEFWVRDGDEWRALTEKTVRETQERIQQTLRMDYETFVNASFFLQGKADEFTQKKPSDRKAVLANILGLEIWETYKERAGEHRKDIERSVDEIDGRLSEIDSELNEADSRSAHLTAAEAGLQNLTSVRAASESALAVLRKSAAIWDEQKKSAGTMSAALERARVSLEALTRRQAARGADRGIYEGLASRSAEIESAYKNWQEARKEVEKWDKVAAENREHEDKRQPFLRVIEAEGARLNQERDGLKGQELVISNSAPMAEELMMRIAEAEKLLGDTEGKLSERGELENLRIAASERQAALKAENERLKIEMDDMKLRIEQLKIADGATCPLCGQDLSEAHRQSTLEGLQNEGTAKGDWHRANKIETAKLAEEIASLQSQISSLKSVEAERVRHSNTIAQLSERLESLERAAAEWDKSGAKRLKEVEKILANGKFAEDARKQLAKLDKELAKLGYDASAHDTARAAEAEGRGAEEELSNLKSAREALKQIENEMASINSEIGIRNSEIAEQEAGYAKVAAALESARAGAPNLETAEHDLLRLREQENEARDEATRARQRVDILETLRERKLKLGVEREQKQQTVAHYKSLERAFGKDGVPALLIEQALPQIEEKANELLDRLSDGRMSIRFETMAEYKDKKREDLKETLDIQISDGSGARDYEMYSGGEAFRVNFAIRLALSEVLAQRKGARLQTLVIDEGFGSQDAQGRQRLIEAINMVRGDFAKILVITHLDELKDAFPTRIEVEKGERGSMVKVI